ncbi:hypothetical protein CHS0354_004702 [Potamilus streckersoni]|uniref:Sodefrin-like factor n=1 Tax=Potamilus streckersoni TaxID=2493646 RepID=A0AAE0T229_9BIVA|nr:hypothetical protein CHS0354_004702 [Potamilus streckersoni]
MAHPLLICGIFLACVFISVEAAAPTPRSHLLECRICRNAIYLEDCKESQICAINEECYIEEIITPQLQVVFNAGCRSKAICSTTQTKRKRADGVSLIACSHCCEDRKTNTSSLECNVKLCGIETNSDHTNQCYYCADEDEAKQADVTDPTMCRKIKFCSDTEVCRATVKSISNKTVHEFGCYGLLPCQMLTIYALKGEGVDAHINVPHLIQTGEIQFNNGRKRQTTVCDICCGDGLCNSDSCFSVRKRIIPFVQAGKFNFTTLTLI